MTAIQRHKAVLLPRHADPADAATVDARGNLAQHAVEGRDPIARVLLHVPGGQSADQPVRRASLGDHAAGVEVERDGLDPLGTGIDANEERHGWTAQCR